MAREHSESAPRRARDGPSALVLVPSRGINVIRLYTRTRAPLRMNWRNPVSKTIANQPISSMRCRNGFIVTREMARYVAIYVGHCRRLIDTADIYKVEVQFDLDALRPPGPMYGTADFIGYFRRRQELHVVDLKYGKGVFVNARDNPQLRYYALGAALRLAEPVATIVSTVVQPRTKGDPIRSAIIDADELAEWAVFWLIDRAHAALDPPLNTWPDRIAGSVRSPRTVSRISAASKEPRITSF